MKINLNNINIVNGVAELTDEQRDALLAQLTTKPSTVWKPEVGDQYYFWNSSGEANWNNWDDDDVDNHRYATGNCFQTKEECQAYGERKTRIETAKANIDRWIIENEVELATGKYGYLIVWDAVQNKVRSWCKEFAYRYYADEICLGKKLDVDRLIAECAADLKMWLTGEV